MSGPEVIASHRFNLIIGAVCEQGNQTVSDSFVLFLNLFLSCFLETIVEECRKKL